jgi:hypothetical protein
VRNDTPRFFSLTPFEPPPSVFVNESETLLPLD